MTVLPEGLININGDSVHTLEILAIMTVVTLLPAIVVMMTSFTRFIVSFSFLRNAMGTQQNPPNMILIGLALFLTFFTMAPTIQQISEEAYTPYVNEEITQAEFFDRAQIPLKRFMLRNTEPSALELFCSFTGDPVPQDVEEGLELPIHVVTPAFATSELKKSFQIGLYLYLPFLLLDIIVSTTLMSMGMMMLPPAMISTPFKLLLFITLDGWELLFSTLVNSFV